MLLSDPAHARWLKIRVLTAEFNIKESLQQCYSLKWNHCVWSESKLNFPWCPAWQEALSGDWWSQAFGKQFTFCTLKQELYSGVVIVYLLCTAMHLPPSTRFTQKGAAASGMLQNVLGSLILKGYGKKLLQNRKQHFHLEAGYQGRALMEASGLNAHFEMMSRCSSGSATFHWSDRIKTITMVPAALRASDLH